jgi:hypothetical protein
MTATMRPFDPFFSLATRGRPPRLRAGSGGSGSPRPLRSLLASCALAGTLAFSPPAMAAGVTPADASAAQKSQATEHFAAGKRALDASDHDTATAEFRASIDIVDSPNTRLELARALRDSGKLAEAWSEYGVAVVLARRLTPSEARYAKTADVASAERRDVEARLAFVVVTVTRAPPDAILTVGGRVVPPAEWSDSLVVAPGEVDVALTDHAGADLAHLAVGATAGETVPVALDVGSPVGLRSPGALAVSDDDKPGTDGRSAPTLATAPPPRQTSPLRPLAYVSMGVGVVGMATFAVFGLLSTSTYDDLKSSCPHGCPADKRSEVDTGTLEQTLANVGLGVGIGGLAVGATMFLLSTSSSSSMVQAALVVGPGYLGMRGTL